MERLRANQQDCLIGRNRKARKKVCRIQWIAQIEFPNRVVRINQGHLPPNQRRFNRTQKDPIIMKRWKREQHK